MVKECPVTINNEVVTVVKYDNVSIQFPSIHKNVKTVFVNYDNGIYSIVDKNFKEISVDKPTGKRNTKKKTTIKESVKENEKDISDTQNA